nr:hypothetical protein [Microbulbifer variabilis]
MRKVMAVDTKPTIGVYRSEMATCLPIASTIAIAIKVLNNTVIWPLEPLVNHLKNWQGEIFAHTKCIFAMLHSLRLSAIVSILKPKYFGARNVTVLYLTPNYC